MTSGPIGLDLAEVAKSNAPQVLDVPSAPGLINEKNEKTLVIADHEPAFESDGSLRGPEGEEYPTAEETEKLRRVCGVVPWSAYTIAFVELCERFSYYGTTAVCKLCLNSSTDYWSDESVRAESKSQSSTSFSTLSPMGQLRAHLALMDNRALWAWASERRPA